MVTEQHVIITAVLLYVL